MIRFASKVFENDYIPIIELRPEGCETTDGVTLAEAEAIEDLSDVECLGINSGKWAKIDRKGKRIKLGQYVGLVTVGQLSFEIFPKVERYGSKSPGAGEADLRGMIAQAEDFHYSSRSFDIQAGHDKKLLEFMADEAVTFANLLLSCWLVPYGQEIDFGPLIAAALAYADAVDEAEGLR